LSGPPLPMNTARQLAKMLLSKDAFNLSPSTNLQSHPPYLSFAVSNPDMKYIMVWRLLMERWLLLRYIQLATSQIDSYPTKPLTSLTKQLQLFALPRSPNQMHWKPLNKRSLFPMDWKPPQRYIIHAPHVPSFTRNRWARSSSSSLSLSRSLSSQPRPNFHPNQWHVEHAGRVFSENDAGKVPSRAPFHFQVATFSFSGLVARATSAF